MIENFLRLINVLNVHLTYGILSALPQIGYNFMKNKTKESILTAALHVFTQKGFAAASISQIAEKAQINQSLIYHHFKSKSDLWVCVKKYCIDEVTKDFRPIRHDTLENFVHDLIYVRFSVYANESMRMLVHWQALESDADQFYDPKHMPHSLFDISNHIKTMQQKKIIRQDTDYQVLSGVIFGLVSYAFFDFAKAFHLSLKKQQAYKKLVSNLLIKTLSEANHD